MEELRYLAGPSGPMYDPRDPDGTGIDGTTDLEKDLLIGQLHMLVVTCIMMAIYILAETFQEHKHIKFGHASTVLMILGMITSVFVYKSGARLH